MNKKDNKKHLSFIALEDGMSITFNFRGTAYYSVNNEEWKRMESGVGTEEVKAGSVIYVKGNTSHPSFKISKKCKLSGFCASILYGDKVSKDSVAYEDCFYHLFYNCTTIVEVDNILPATTLANSCYGRMFEGCTSLVNAPELPATTLAKNCYSNMFIDCTNLANAPELPATTLAENCYDQMFRGCTSLVNAPKLPATTLAEYCYNRMFEGCTSLVNAPELPAITLAENCYEQMFRDCTNLANAPELPATTLARYCYYLMFRSCANLNYIKMLAADISAESCLDVWVRGVSSTGTFVKSKDATWDTTPGALGDSGVPAGWTVVNDGEESGGGNDFDIEFPLYLTFDECTTNWVETECVRYADDISKKLFEVLKDVINQYGESDVVTGQILELLGIEIYIENSKITDVQYYNIQSEDMLMITEDGRVTTFLSDGTLIQNYITN